MEGGERGRMMNEPHEPPTPGELARLMGWTFALSFFAFLLLAVLNR